MQKYSYLQSPLTWPRPPSPFIGLGGRGLFFSQISNVTVVSKGPVPPAETRTERPAIGKFILSMSHWFMYLVFWRSIGERMALTI